MHTIYRRLLWAILSLALLPAASRAQDDLPDQYEAAIRAAVQKVAPSVVRIETVGGLEVVGQISFGLGPTTGLIISEDGYIVSSAFNFLQKPSSILISLPDGTRAPATLVATDHARKLVLLKVQVGEKDKLVVPEFVPENEMAVGQTAIAVGRTFEGSQPNLAVGIVSALRRVYGRAIQSDCKISPSNYGGPLVDIRGRVLGVLAPLSPQSDETVAGYDWYDSGIGFAVPLAHVMLALPRLKSGNDLFPGVMGINLRQGDQFADPAIIAAVRGNSPAAQAGLKPEDIIQEVAGKKIVRQIQVKEALGPYYAGDKVKVVVLRGKETIEREIELIAKLQPYTRPFVGILPMRLAKAAAPAEGAAPQGVEVRFVFDDSGAQAAGLLAGDRILSVQGKPVATLEALREVVSGQEPTRKIKLEIQRGEQKLQPEVTLGTLPETVPAKLPPAMAGRKPYVGPQPPVGRQPFKLPEHANDAILYVPEGYDPAVPHGLVVWFHEPNGLKTDEQADLLIARWKPYCETHDLILVAPKAGDPVKWEPAKETPYVQALCEKLRSTYTIDDARIVAAGHQAGGSMAYHVAFQQRELFRGVAAADIALSTAPVEADPVYPLAFFTTKAKQGRSPLPQVEAGIKRLRDLKYPVTVKDQGEAGRHLNDEEFAELVRWIDSLDKI